jgi:hypothetical protein
MMQLPVLPAHQDRAVQLRLSDDRLTVFGDKGYCMARATHYVGMCMLLLSCRRTPEGFGTISFPLVDS